MASIDEVLAAIPMDRLAAQLGVDPATAEQASRQALPALLGGMEANAQDPAGARRSGRRSAATTRASSRAASTSTRSTRTTATRSSATSSAVSATRSSTSSGARAAATAA